jgi:hypothetical protein
MESGEGVRCEMHVSNSLTGESFVDDILRRHPLTSAVFLQHGPAMRTPPGRLFPDHIKMTLHEYADLKGVSIEELLHSLNAAVETERFVGRNPWMVSKRNGIEVSPGIYVRATDF